MGMPMMDIAKVRLQVRQRCFEEEADQSWPLSASDVACVAAIDDDVATFDATRKSVK